VVEDEENLLEALRYNLDREGYQVHTALDGDVGLACVRRETPDLVILDVMLPKLDGFELCRIIRRESDVPVLMLTAKGEETDRVVGLELGADDYVLKPFSMRELLARVRAVLRRSRTTASLGPWNNESLVTAGPLVIDLIGHIVLLSGEPVALKPREFELLVLLVTNEGRAFTRDQILDRLWGQDYVGDIRTVDVHIRGLRKKVESDPNLPTLISTIRGIGYRFDA
jgi:two-component system OmpR family response regulator